MATGRDYDGREMKKMMNRKIEIRIGEMEESDHAVETGAVRRGEVSCAGGYLINVEMDRPHPWCPIFLP